MRKPTFVGLLVWINGGVPAALLLYDAWNKQLGANPVNFALLTTGLLALIFLALSLAVTPVRELTGWSSLFPARRTAGLWAAIYAFAHVCIFFWWDRERSVSGTIDEIIERKYLWFGTVAVLIFIPLTLTSTADMVRRLGSRRWKSLHRLVYVAGIGAAVHYLMQGKFVSTQSIVFASIIGALLVWRVVAQRVRRGRAEKKPKPMPATIALKP
jgi:sulfoxide reductase heme-binding subunit YedZ